MAARMPMMIMTTRSSMRVKPPSFCSCDLRMRANMPTSPSDEYCDEVSPSALALRRARRPTEAAGLSAGDPWLCEPPLQEVCRFWPMVLVDDERDVDAA